MGALPSWRWAGPMGATTMRFMNPLLVVTDMDRSVEFYEEVLGLRVETDLGANKVLTGGLALQTADTYRNFIGREVSFGANDAEVYFEEEDFDAFADRLDGMRIELVHPVKEHSWGQRVVRLYDPDRHIVEVGESMRTVCQRFLDGGMTREQVTERMDVPPEYVDECLRRHPDR